LKTLRQARWRAGVSVRNGKAVSAAALARITTAARDEALVAFPLQPGPEPDLTSQRAMSRTLKNLRQARWRARVAGGVIVTPAEPKGAMRTIYLLHCQGFYKIGKTTILMLKRLKGLRTGNPFDTTVVHVFETIKADHSATELILHELFACHRRERSEWFTLPPEAITFICSLTAENYRDKIGVECLQNY